MFTWTLAFNPRSNATEIGYLFFLEAFSGSIGIQNKLSTLSTILKNFLGVFWVFPHVVYILSTLYFCSFTPISWNLSPFLTSFLPKISSFTHLSTKLSTLSTKLSTQSIKVLYRGYPQFYPHSPQIWNCIFCCGCAILYSEAQDNHQTTYIDYRW